MSASTPATRSAATTTSTWRRGALGSNLDAAAFSATGSGTGDGKFAGFIGGGEIGHDWRLAPTIVAGVETDIQGVAGGGGASFASAEPGVLAPADTFPGSVTVPRSLDYLGALRGRVGYLSTPSLLLYATGGLAYGGTSLSSSFLGTETKGSPAWSGCSLAIGAPRWDISITTLVWSRSADLCSSTASAERGTARARPARNSTATWPAPA